MKIAFTLIAAAALTGSLACAQVVTPETPAPAPPAAKTHPKGALNPATTEPLHTAKRSRGDSLFVVSAARGGMAEVQLGKLAAEQGSSNSIKDFADHMVTDHSAANDELEKLAKKDRITLPTGPSAKQKTLYNRLSALSGSAFDRAYIQAMIEDHQKAVAEFTRASSNASDPDIKEFASHTLPTIADHLKMAQQIQTNMQKAKNTDGK
ncbi:MAG TPA: DUF4142 domain-containing protein [Bryobacteraceae bacterium]|nr:DUF4142 domain-containing protein [Bryobacteraceae bacterium]